MSTLNASAAASPSSQRLLDKTAIITGASSGLGRAIALAYATHGAAVVCADLRPVAEVHVKEGDTKATHEVILESGGKSLFVECDVRDSQSVQRLIARAVEVYGRLDIMVNNAGIGLEVPLLLPVHETPDSTFDTTMSVNSRGVFLGCKYAAQQMITQNPYPSGDRGWIINVASVAGVVGLGGTVSYSASKGSVVQITRTVALDLASWRIHCNVLCPGFTKTAMIKPLTDVEATQARLGAMHPFKGLGEPEDIAKAALFLASDDASWVSGAALPVDGGYTAQ